MAHRVLIADNVSEQGIDLLRSAEGFEVTVRTGMDPGELAAVIGEYDALIVRSATKVTAEVLAAPGRLRAIGRAGTGVDNIDLSAATRAGIVVMNTPGGNSVAAAELTIALLTSLARNVPQANQDLRAGNWSRKKYVGTELAGKTLGVIGLGRIGREVVRRGLGLRLEVLGHDPFITQRLELGAGFRSVDLDTLLAESDIVTLHVPRTEDTRNLIDAAALGRMKRGAMLINCARGGLIDEDALLDALEREQLAGAALDVFEREPPEDRRLVEHPRVVATPHLGASTLEAQVRVGREIAQKIRTFLEQDRIQDAVNFPSIDAEAAVVLQPIMDLGERLGTLLTQIGGGGLQCVEVATFGTFGEVPLRPIAMAAVRGVLSPVVANVSQVNALGLAEERGIRVDESRTSEKAPPYSGLLRLTLRTDTGSTTVAGTLMGPGRPRVVEIDGVSIESDPHGHLLVIRNRDLPGVVGKIGTLLGEADVNIGGFRLGRGGEGEASISILDVDGAVPAATLDRIRTIEEIVSVHAVSI